MGSGGEGGNGRARGRRGVGKVCANPAGPLGAPPVCVRNSLQPGRIQAIMRKWPFRTASGSACALALLSCATGPAPSPCPSPTEVVSLLRVDCTGTLVEGRARARVEGSAVVLEPAGAGFDAVATVASWPPREAPPWLGHDVVEIRPLGRDRVRVEFGTGRDPPLLLFADRRLAPPGSGAAEWLEGDGRDRVDSGGPPFWTHDERTVEYAMSRDRRVERGDFDRRYYLVFRDPPSEDIGLAVAARLVTEWARRGVEGTRRAPDPTPLWAAEACVAPTGSVTGVRAASGSDRFSTVAYAAEDPAARELAESVVSASLPGRTPRIPLDGLRVRADSDGLSTLAETDVAAVVPVPVGAVHPCTVRGEISLTEDRLAPGRPRGGVRSFAVGESAVFRIDPGGA